MTNYILIYVVGLIVCFLLVGVDISLDLLIDLFNGSFTSRSRSSVLALLAIFIWPLSLVGLFLYFLFILFRAEIS